MIPSLVQIEREIGLRGSVKDFLRLSWPIIEPGRKFLDNWHLDAVSEHLQAIHKGDIRRLIINVPPGTCKSLLTSVAWPTWVWIRDPGFRFIVASYDGNLTIRDARRQLQIIDSAWFKARWGDRILIGKDPAAGDFTNTAGGFRYSASVEGPVTGRHADCQIVDDPIKPKNLTRKALDGCIDWWDGTMSSRMADPTTGRRVMIMQRLHDDDLAGYCARSGGYELLRLPMRFEPKACSYTKIGGDLRTTDGELLWPARFPESAIASLEREMGSRVAAAQLQQNPVPDGGNIFKKEWFKHYTTLPAKFDHICQSWDLAFKGTNNSDYVVGQVWGQVGGTFYLLDCVRDKLSFPETLEAIRALTKKWPRVTMKLVEDKANGPAVISTLEKEIPGLVAVNPEGGKEARANAIAPLYEAGNVYHPHPSICLWVSDHEEEMLRFPFGSYDDSVDAATQALLHLYGKQSNYFAALQKIADGKFSL